MEMHSLEQGQSEHQQGQTQQQHFAIQKTSSFVDETNLMHVYGELKNISNKAMKNVVVTHCSTIQMVSC